MSKRGWSWVVTSTVVFGAALANAGCGGSGDASNDQVSTGQGTGGSANGGTGGTSATGGTSHGGTSSAGSGGVSAGGAKGGTSQSGGSGGSAGTGGNAGSAGNAGSGGMSCPPIPPLDPTTLGDPCCMGAPTHCVPIAEVPGNLSNDFTACNAKAGGDGRCMPDEIISQGSAFVPTACMFTPKSPGVCLSKCIPLIANDPNVAILTQKTCIDGDLCVPCINPLTMAPTGACDLPSPSCATGSAGSGGMGGSGAGGTPSACPYTGPPLLDPTMFAECSPTCGGAHCLPSSLVPPADASLLAACTDTSGSPGYCTPDTFIESGGNGLPVTCKSVGGAEGRCISTCLPEIASEASLLPDDICQPGEKCAPCYNPFAKDPTAPTGACSLACDKPANPPLMVTCPYTGPALVDPSTLAPCDNPTCGTGAHCLDGSLIPDSEKSLLAQCKDGKSYCAPDIIIQSGGEGLPQTCKSLAGLEGRCLSECLPSVAAKSALLPQDICGVNELCVPCYDPTVADPTKSSTGACNLACDKPVNGPMSITCPYTGPAIIDASQFPACAPSCGGAHCVPASLIPAPQQSLLATCPGGFCAPDTIVESGGQAVPKTCKSVADVEGRCTSICLPSVGSKAQELPKDICGDGELCAPCFDPTEPDPSKAATGACSLACDKPATGPMGITCPYTGPDVIDPSTFPACAPACGGAHCVPAALIPTSQATLLSSCDAGKGPGSGYCAPDKITASGGEGVPKSCTSVAGSEGRCTSTCLPSIAAQASLLPQDVCEADEKCAPCFNPFGADPTAPTGACSLACDAPKNPPTQISCPYTGPQVLDPTTFPACAPACGGAHCVPSALVPAAQTSLLAPCPGGYCAPDTITSTGGEGVPKSCTSVAGAEGRCTSTCLPSVAAEASLLPVDVCGANEVCAPCYNPVASDPTASTGACNLACDAPAKPPTLITCPWNGNANVIDPTKLPDCAPACAGAHCLSASLVPAADQGELAKCGTPGNPGYCAPDTIIESAGNYVPKTCDPFGDAKDEGRCLSTCLPSVAADASSLRKDVCDANQLCVPCYDPFSGLSTGACSSASCDMPKKPKFDFPTCCPNSQGAPGGTCVPGADVPAAQKGNLQQSGCPTSGAAYLCVPDEYLPTPTMPIGTCSNALGNQGTCVSKCVNIPFSFLFTQEQCPDNHLCVICALAPSTPGCPGQLLLRSRSAAHSTHRASREPLCTRRHHRHPRRRQLPRRLMPEAMVRARHPQMMLSLVAERMPRLGEEIQARLPAETRETLAIAPPSLWIPVVHDIRVLEVVKPQIGQAMHNVLLQDRCRQEMGSPLFKGFVATILRLFGASPAVVVKQMGKGWAQLFQDIGTFEVIHVEEDAATVVLRALPAECLASTIWVDGVPVALEPIFELVNATATIASTIDPRGDMHLQISWRKGGPRAEGPASNSRRG